MLVDIEKFPYIVRIPWKKGDTANRWDQIGILAVQTYGLPGGKYTTHPTTEYMDFYFKDHKDAVWFRLRAE